MQINPKLIKNHFEKSMDKYNENAIVQKFMAEILAKEISDIQTKYDKILELGCGTGILTEILHNKITYKSYTANDLTPKSKKYLDKILKNYNYICGNAKKIRPNSQFNLIVSNAMFQWFQNLEEVLSKYHNMLDCEGILAFTTFSPENFQELKSVTGLTLDYKPIEELQNILEKNYKILKLYSFKKILTFNSPLELLYHMKNTGVNSLNNHSWNFKDVKDFCTKYSQTYQNVTLTYSPILAVAQKLN